MAASQHKEHRPARFRLSEDWLAALVGLALLLLALVGVIPSGIVP